MNKHFAMPGRAACALALAIALVGCADTTPHWDNSFGGTVRQALAAQVARPAAARSTDPVAGVDGASARATYERYVRSSANPPEPADPVSVSGKSK